MGGINSSASRRNGQELHRARLQGEVEELKVGAAQNEAELAKVQAQLQTQLRKSEELEEKNATLKRQVKACVPNNSRAASVHVYACAQALPPLCY